MTLPSAWQVSIGGLVVVFAIALSWLGASRIPPTKDSRRSPKVRASLATAGLLLILLCLDGPLHRLSEQWLAWHMVSHVLVMFYAPVLLVFAGAPELISAAFQGRSGFRSLSQVGRAVSAVLGKPLVAVLVFNGVMVFWHVPAIFDWHMEHSWSTELLMEPSFVLAGYFFWRLIVAGPDDAPRARPRTQVVAVLTTALVMLVLAMWMSVGASAPWYAEPVAMHGTAVALRDQHYAAGVLWVCGDLWAIPALVLIALRVVEGRGGASAVLDSFVKRGS
jgi:cytochrome c oxidase assembly factor CtaG